MIKIQSFPLVKQLISMLVFVFIARIGLACSCGSYEPNFYKNISGKTYICMAVYDTTTTGYNSNINTYDYTGYFIVSDTIGNSGLKTGDTIPVIGQNGLNCGEVLSQFSIGDTLFLCLQKNYFGQSLKENFFLEGDMCGNFHLKLTNGKMVVFD